MPPKPAKPRLVSLALVTVLVVGTAGLAVQTSFATAPSGTATGPSAPTTASTPTITPIAPASTSTTTISGSSSRETLRPGASGTAVTDLQEELTRLGYWLGPADGTYGDLTRQAVLAFQKAEGLERDGIAGPSTLGRLEEATPPTARSPMGRAIEIDRDRQILLVVRDESVRWVINTSTGASATPTPLGRFEIERRLDRVRHAPLGDLYRPAYFHGGIAVHGFPRVPARPASHGCTRVSLAAMDMLWSTGAASRGTPVWVY